MSMTKEEIKSWLLQVLERQTEHIKTHMDNVLYHLEEERDWKNAAEEQRKVDYWLSRAKNTMRLLEEEDLV